MKWLNISLVAVLSAAAVAYLPQAGFAAQPGNQSFTTIGDTVHSAGERPTHIIFVHGMRAEGPDTSATLRGKLCEFLSGGCSLEAAPPEGRRHYVDLGPTAPTTTVAGERVWKNDADWRASRPFVDRYVFKRPSGGSIVLDEVNWWPLLFPLKCKMLVGPEALLSGADEDHLALCANSTPPFHAWLQPSDVSQKPANGGGAWLNGMLKQQIMNWGLSDAVLALGPMRVYLRQSLDQAFDYAATDSTGQGDPSYVVISESLGSFVVLDTYQNHDPGDDTGVRAVLTRTYNLYFFANQFRLLELGRLGGMAESADHRDMMSPPAPVDASGDVSGSPVLALYDWAAGPRGPLSPPRQIVAFNDPSDALTFDVPPISGAEVVNVPDQNGFNYFGLFENPVKAHTGHSRNPKVLKSLFTRSGQKQ